MFKLFLLSLLAGVLYRAGGTGGKWYLNTKVRDVGVPLVFLGAMYWIGLWHWSLLICAVLLFVTLTSYNKWAGRLLGYPEDDVYWPSWLVTGLLYGLSLIPYAYFSGHLTAILVRAMMLAVLTMLWSCVWAQVEIEESGRGALIILTLAVLL